MFKILHQDGEARYGILKTAHGTTETPFFMPVATKTAVKCLDPRDLKEIGINAVISNSFVLTLLPGIDIIKNGGGIHKFMNFDGVIFTDSGGFQKIRDSFKPRITDKGVAFKSPIDGTPQLITPKKAMEIQETIGSDVAMIIDDMPLVGSKKEDVKKAMERTHKWAVECLEHHTDKKQLLFGIAQGGFFKDLREESAKFIGSLDFDGFAFGGLAIGETPKETREMINLSVQYFPKNKPRYLMGVGNPKQLVESISAGVDCFDSTFPTQNARHGTIFTSEGRLIVKNAKYRLDNNPLDKNCDCYVCKSYTRSHIRHLLKCQEANGLRYCTYHNIYYLNNLMKEIRIAIKEGRFEKYKEEFMEKYSNDWK